MYGLNNFFPCCQSSARIMHFIMHFTKRTNNAHEMHEKVSDLRIEEGVESACAQWFRCGCGVGFRCGFRFRCRIR